MVHWAPTGFQNMGNPISLGLVLLHRWSLCDLAEVRQTRGSYVTDHSCFFALLHSGEQKESDHFDHKSYLLTLPSYCTKHKFCVYTSTQVRLKLKCSLCSLCLPKQDLCKLVSLCKLLRKPTQLRASDIQSTTVHT
jgi:hypothetical protein